MCQANVDFALRKTAALLLAHEGSAVALPEVTSAEAQVLCVYKETYLSIKRPICL